MSEEKTSDKKPRVGKHLRGMRLSTTEAALAQVVGAFVAGRCDPEKQAAILDEAAGASPQPMLWDEIVHVSGLAGLTYDLQDGVTRFKARRQMIADHPGLVRRNAELEQLVRKLQGGEKQPNN